MRVAVLSDIHGNADALQAVLDDVKRRAPDAIVNRLQQVAHEALQSADIRRTFAELGGVPGGETAAEHDAFIAQERKRWAEIVRAANLSLD